MEKIIETLMNKKMTKTICTQNEIENKGQNIQTEPNTSDCSMQTCSPINMKEPEKATKGDNTKKKRKLITKIDKKSNPHKKEMQMILRNNTQKQRNQLEETALQVYGEATDEQEFVSIGSLSSDLEEHSFIVSNSEKTLEDINQKSLLGARNCTKYSRA
ncbi:hypothetical protein JTB14_028399 [Gonioctena quinquepunctata]|nr:hypothetical protein JTB14_028399 [Gonioctena quinquepunctata]